MKGVGGLTERYMLLYTVYEMEILYVYAAGRPYSIQYFNDCESTTIAGVR
jgi:hypothetical protein